jgi:hypothetical protein
LAIAVIVRILGIVANPGNIFVKALYYFVVAGPFGYRDIEDSQNVRVAFGFFVLQTFGLDPLCYGSKG